MQDCYKCKKRFVRDKNMSNSEFGQWIHDSFPNTFFGIDVYQVIYKQRTRILRILEQKLTHQQLKPSQECILLLLATAVDHLLKTGLVDEQSGVFVVFSDPPFKSASITQIGKNISLHLDGEEWERFIAGEKIKTPYYQNYNYSHEDLEIQTNIKGGLYFYENK
jgi:hypothetical protein